MTSQSPQPGSRVSSGDGDAEEDVFCPTAVGTGVKELEVAPVQGSRA